MDITLISIIAALFILIVVQNVEHRNEKQMLLKNVNLLLNKLMSKDYKEYVQANVVGAEIEQQLNDLKNVETEGYDRGLG
jgi:hypothetical protein